MDSTQKFVIVKTELNLIQATLDKYDDLIYRGRNFFATLWLATVGLGSPYVPNLCQYSRPFSRLCIGYWKA